MSRQLDARKQTRNILKPYQKGRDSLYLVEDCNRIEKKKKFQTPYAGFNCEIDSSRATETRILSER